MNKKIKNESNSVEIATISTDNDLQEINTPNNLEFPVMIQSTTLSKMYLKTIPWHWHPEIEMIYVQEGKVNAMIDEESFILTPGQGIFINQNVLHSFHHVEGYEAVFFSLTFHPAMIFGYGKAALSVKYLSPILENPSMPCLILSNNDPYTAPLIQYTKNIYKHYTASEYGYELVCKANICHLWNDLLKVPHNKMDTVLKPKHIHNDEQRIKDAIVYIEQHYNEQITLDDIARSIPISKSECCRCFKRILHQTPFEYLLKYRIFQATKLIQHQDPIANSISNLAIHVGFSNISYFNKVFKRYLKMTPSEYKHNKCEMTIID